MGLRPVDLFFHLVTGLHREADVEQIFVGSTVDFHICDGKDGKKTANARITVRHNGVLIHDNVELPKRTTASPLAEGPEPGFLHLQDHSNPLRFRNIWVVKK